MEKSEVIVTKGSEIIKGGEHNLLGPVFAQFSSEPRTMAVPKEFDDAVERMREEVRKRGGNGITHLTHHTVSHRAIHTMLLTTLSGDAVRYVDPKL